jgi:hypothetical protein
LNGSRRQPSGRALGRVLGEGLAQIEEAAAVLASLSTEGPEHEKE